VSDDRADMDTQLFQLFLVACAAIEEKIVELGLRFFGVRIAETSMDGRPAEDGGHGAFFTMDENALRGSDLLVDAAVTFQVQETFRCDIVDEPADLVCMGFDHHLKRSVGVDDADRRAVRVGEMSVHKWFQVFEPELLTAAFKT